MRENRPLLRFYFIFAQLCVVFSCTATVAKAQAAPAALSADQIAARIVKLHPKTLVLVFDVTASTKTGGVFGEERAASATLIRDGCQPGDRIVLEAFGTGYKTVFDKTLTSDGDQDALVDALPADITPGAGTNIRLPHQAALKLIAADPSRPGVIVLLTDSFNDRPKLSDPNYPQYLAFYSLKGLTIYPDTPENRDYERLLRTLKASGRLHQYGVGVGIATSGRPIERLPIGPGQGDQPGDTTSLTPTVLAPMGHEHPRNSLVLPIGVGIFALLLIGVVFFVLQRPLPIRLILGERGTPRDYRLKRGAKIGIGGTITSAAPGDDVFPLAGLSTPVASLQNASGATRLVPATGADGTGGATLFHNGLKLEQAVPVRVGDEIRVSVAATEAAPAREYRIKVGDPHAAAF